METLVVADEQSLAPATSGKNEPGEPEGTRASSSPELEKPTCDFTESFARDQV